MAMLLIGSTGNGKSTLGNFIINPEKDHIFGEHQTFKTARTNFPETQYVQSSTLNEKLEELDNSDHLTVIDTPGIFEDEEKDIEHMVNIIKALHDVGEIRACVLVMRFSSKIDTPYRASVNYYSKLLPGLFETNLIVVVTDYACDQRTKSLRELQGIDQVQIKKNFIDQIMEVSGISRIPKLFTIDCLPILEDEFAVNLKCRKEIIKHIYSFQSMSTKNLKVAKTDSIMASDRVEIAKLEGEVTAYKERFMHASNNSKMASDRLEELAQAIQNLDTEVVSLKNEIADKDTRDLVDANVWSVRDKWKCFKVLTRRFQVKSQWPIQNVDYWTNGKCRWVRKNMVDEYCVQGVVKGKFMRGLYAKVTLEVFKCDMNSEDIEHLRTDVGNKEELLAKNREEHDASKQKCDEINEQISSLTKIIDEKTEGISKLSSEYLTVEECLQRFHV